MFEVTLAFQKGGFCITKIISYFHLQILYRLSCYDCPVILFQKPHVLAFAKSFVEEEVPFKTLYHLPNETIASF